MPKIAKSRIEENRQVIESAALALFTRQGFHGTNIREIADKAAVSIGAIYTYYSTKEALFASIVHNSERRLGDRRAEMFLAMEDPFSPEGLMELAQNVRSIVYDHADHWRLMYIDVLEFDNRHFADKFQNLAEQFRQRLSGPFAKAVKHRGWCGQDPGFVYANIYLNIMTYFLVEKLFAGNQHLGVSDDVAMENIVALVLRGIWKVDPSKRDGSARSGKKPGKEDIRTQSAGKRDAKPPARKTAKKIAKAPRQNRRNA
jgi:AcrR family transcriptional regulator